MVRSEKWVRCCLIILVLVGPLGFVSAGSTNAIEKVILAVDDTFVSSEYPDLQYGNFHYISLWPGKEIGFIKFDLREIPRNSTIISASVSFRPVSSPTDIRVTPISIDLFIYRDNDWYEGTLTWNLVKWSCIDSTPLGSVPMQGLDWHSWQIDPNLVNMSLAVGEISFAVKANSTLMLAAKEGWFFWTPQLRVEYVPGGSSLPPQDWGAEVAGYCRIVGLIVNGVRFELYSPVTDFVSGETYLMKLLVHSDSDRPQYIYSLTMELRNDESASTLPTSVVSSESPPLFVRPRDTKLFNISVRLPQKPGNTTFVLLATLGTTRLDVLVANCTYVTPINSVPRQTLIQEIDNLQSQVNILQLNQSRLLSQIVALQLNQSRLSSELKEAKASIGMWQILSVVALIAGLGVGYATVRLSKKPLG